MTIEEAIGFSASELEAMSEDDLQKHFAQYLIVTRPEMAPRVMKQEQRVMTIDPKFLEAQQIAKKLGINLPTFKPMGKRKT